MNATHLTILLFAGVAELAGQRELSLAWPGGTVADLRSLLRQQLPAAEALLARCAIAVGERYCLDDEQVPPEADVAVIPPVSGG
jgi:molybdopterin converting factor small subunit